MYRLYDVKPPMSDSLSLRHPGIYYRPIFREVVMARVDDKYSGWLFSVQDLSTLYISLIHAQVWLASSMAETDLQRYLSMNPSGP